METKSSSAVLASKVEPLCPVFHECGGCLYQDIPYEEELKIKENHLRKLFHSVLGYEGNDFFRPIVASPKEYAYRHRLDLTLRRTKTDGILFGFQSAASHKMIPIDACSIARQEVSDYLPELRKLSLEKMTEKYRTANLVIKTGDDGRVKWGGIGRRSLELKPEDYLWTEIHGRRIFYSLDSFFQANLSILPRLMDEIESLVSFDSDTCFLDLYAGVGLFGIYFAERAGKILMIEASEPSLAVMKHNIAYHHLENKVELVIDRVESVLAPLSVHIASRKSVAIIDPPRNGLHPEALECLAAMKSLSGLLYLSCHPESLMRDLQHFLKEGWKIQSVTPFDFFPKTQHLETLVLLCR